MMYTLLLVFAAVYPFLLLPWGENVDEVMARSGYLVLFTFLFLAGFLFLWFKHKYRPKMLPASWVFLVFLGLATISTLASDFRLDAWFGEVYRYEGLRAWYSYITLFIAALSFITPHNYRRILGGLVLGGFISSIYGIMQHFGANIMSYTLNVTRSYSFFRNPNFFGAYLILVVMAGAVLYVLANTRKSAAAWFIFTLTAYIALIYSETRGAWLGLAAGVVLFAVFSWAKINRIRFVSLILAFIFIFGLISIEGGNHLSRMASLDNEVVKFIDGDVLTASGRGYVWQESLPLVKEYFWLGSGPDTFGRVFPQDGFIYWDKAHNEFLQIAVTMGTPALLIYMAGLLLVFLKSFGAVRKSEDADKRVTMSGLLAACLGYQVHALVNISTIGVAPFFWIILGITYRLGVEYHVIHISSAAQDIIEQG